MTARPRRAPSGCCQFEQSDMTKPTDDIRVFRADHATMNLAFTGFFLLFAFGVWLTFFASAETIASDARLRAFGGALGPISMVLFGFFSWLYRPTQYLRAKRDLILAPASLRYNGMRVRWSQISGVKETIGPKDTKFVSLSIINPDTFKASQLNLFHRLVGGTGESVDIPPMLLNATEEELIAAVTEYWHEYRESHAPDVATPSLDLLGSLGIPRRTGWQTVWGISILLGIAGMTAVLLHKGSVSKVAAYAMPAKKALSQLELTNLMRREATNFDALLSNAATDGREGMTASPMIDSLNRTVHFQMVLRDSSIVLYEEALIQMVQRTRTDLCRLYLQTALGEHDVVVRQTTSSNSGALLFSIDVTRQNCPSST